MNFTPAQTTAIHYPDDNLLLSAAAGSGKTATLTERILYLLENDRASLSRMLIVTYTRAAAAELRGRIGQKITDRAKSTGSRKLARHLTELPGAQISTIHAFLYRTLRPSFASLGLSPDFTIGDEAVIDTLRQEAMRDTLDDFYAAGEPDFVTLADTLAGSRDTEALDRTLLSIYAQITSAGEDAASLVRYGQALSEGGDFFAMPQSEPIRRRIRAAVDHYTRTIAHLRNHFDGNAEKQYGPAAQGDLDFLAGLDAALDGGSYEQIRRMFADFTPVKLGKLAAKDATEESDAFKAVRNAMKKDISRFSDSFFSDPAELVAESVSRTAGMLVTCSRVLGAYAEAFRSRKMSRSLLDYGDLEALALQLFLDGDGNPTDTALEVGRQFDYIFVDEYQDTNRVQDAIFRALGAETPRFMVGDSKQSIYRFRGAEPSVFARYRDRWPVQSPAAAEEMPADPGMSAPEVSFSPDAGHCLFMSENFRCDSTVVDFVNLVSDYLLSRTSMPYAPEDALVFGKGAGEKIPAEIVLVEKPSAGEEDEDTRSGGTDAEEADPEAEYVAQRIADMLAGEPIDGRPLTPDDFAILLRSPDTNGAAFRQSLARRGIPVQMPGGEVLFASPVVLLTMCLLHTADNPLYDIPVAGAMHSPLFGFATHEMVILRDWSRKTLAARYHWDGDMPLYYVVQMAADPDWKFAPEDADTAAGTDSCADETAPAEITGAQLSMFTETDPVENSMVPGETGTQDGFAGKEMLSGDTPWENDPVENRNVSGQPMDTDAAVPQEPEPLPEDLVEKCRRFRDAAAEMREMAHGMRADRFLDELFRMYALFDLPEVRDNPAEKDNLHALYDLARRYESGVFGGVGGFLTYAEELQDKKQSAGEGDSLPAVHILSIHKSKGLEFPVVFVSACSKRRNARDEMGDILFDPDLGFGMRLPDTGGYARCGTALRSAIGEKKRLESVEEEMRVVYVALTRARNRLVVTGKVKDAEEFLAACRLDAEYATAYSVTGGCTYLQWITSAALAHGPDPCFRLLTVEQTDEADAALPDASEETAEVPDWDTLLTGNMDYLYPLSYLAKVPAKLTVSKLHERVLDAEPEGIRLSLDEPSPEAVPPESEAQPEAAVPGTTEAAGREMPMPRFMTGTAEQMTAAQRGTATHMFLQFADFASLAENGVEAELTRLVEKHFLDEETARGVYVTQLERFRKSGLFARMLAAPLCRREFRFNAPMAAHRFTENPDFAEVLRRDGVRLIVQGVVDCVFREADGSLTLVDYKTDRPTAEEYKNPALADARFAARHGAQLAYYKEICAAMFGEEIRRVVIYATALGREIVVQ